MAALHARCFTSPRPWKAEEFASFLADPLCFALVESDGFLIGRAVADEAEILTLAVDPARWRNGIGGRLVQGFLAEAAQRQAVLAFLEVSANNQPAISLYLQAGFEENGRRAGYYADPNGTRVDALAFGRVI